MAGKELEKIQQVKNGVDILRDLLSSSVPSGDEKLERAGHHRSSIIEGKKIKNPMDGDPKSITEIRD